MTGNCGTGGINLRLPRQFIRPVGDVYSYLMVGSVATGDGATSPTLPHSANIPPPCHTLELIGLSPYSVLLLLRRITGARHSKTTSNRNNGGGPTRRCVSTLFSGAPLGCSRPRLPRLLGSLPPPTLLFFIRGSVQGGRGTE